MKVGGKSQLVCLADIAYGDRGAPLIPVARRCIRKSNCWCDAAMRSGSDSFVGSTNLVPSKPEASPESTETTVSPNDQKAYLEKAAAAGRSKDRQRPGIAT
jgi:hypothetical protein